MRLTAPCASIAALVAVVTATAVGSPVSSDAHALAERFRPILLFDSREHWRPVSVASIFEAGQVHLCASNNTCPLITSPDLLPSAGGRLDVDGRVGDARSYHSDNSACVGKVVFDCDSQTATPLYFHASSQGGYTYLDYWVYYRYNDAPGGDLIDDHESDWEGITVAVSQARSDSFDFVEFAAHRGVYRYLADVLRCGDRHLCGAGEPRVDVYVANGTHASYPRACPRLFKNIALCRQNAFPYAESAFDGHAPWGSNDTSTVVDLADQSWSSWPGTWSPSKIRVDSPGNQPRFRSPWKATCIRRWSDGREGACLVPQESVADPCASWFTPLTAAVACDPKKLTRALETGTLGVGRSVEIQRGGESASTSVGVSQSVGAPLGAGEQLRLTGPRTNGSRLFVAIQGGNGLTGIARFDRLGLRDTGVSTVRVEQRRRVPTATIVPEGTFAFAPTPIKPTAVRYFKR